jgi:hypothetical protein
MERLAWNKVLDNYLRTHKMTVDDYEDFNDIQRALIQELKRSFSRTKEVVINETHHSLINKNNDK